MSTPPTPEPERLVPVTADDLADLVQPRPTPEQPGAAKPLSTPADADALADLRRRAAEPDSVRALLAEKVGVAKDADLTTITAALDKVLSERPFAGPPAGSELVDTPTLERLRADADEARTVERRSLLAWAINTGRVTPAERARWERRLDNDYAAEAAELRRLPVKVPVAPVGYSVDPEGKTSEDELYDSIFGGQPPS